MADRVLVADIVEEILMSIEDDDFLSNSSEALVGRYARRGLREISLDNAAELKSKKFEINTETQTLNFPVDFVDLVKIGVVGSDGMVYVLGHNKNINYSLSAADSGVVDKSPTSTPGGSSDDQFDQYVFHNYFANGTHGQLYGVGGGQRYGEYRINRRQGRFEFSSNNNIKEVVIEYLVDPASDQSPYIHAYLEEALRAYIYYRLIERKASVPAGEKARARKEYYNELRKGKSRLSTFTKEDALRVIRKNFKQSPKL